MIERKNAFELCDIWRLRNPQIKRLTFDFCIITGLALFNVNWTFFSFKVSTHKTDALASFCSDHSPILFALDMMKKG